METLAIIGIFFTCFTLGVVFWCEECDRLERIKWFRIRNWLIGIDIAYIILLLLL